MGRRARAWGGRSPGTTCAATGGSAVPGLPPRDQPTQALTHARARSPSVLWVDRMTLERAPQLQSLRQLVRKIDNLVIGELRKRDPYLKFVEERSDPMLAIYPADGAGFKRHVDNSAGDGRVLTVLCYLNPSWEPERGGMLRLSPDRADGRPVDVCPVGGRLAMFYADRIAHEVMPSYEVRHAVTIWHYDAKERKETQQDPTFGPHCVAVHELLKPASPPDWNDKPSACVVS